MTKVSLISGITGQDGSYLADLLLHKNHKVIGLHRRSSTNNLERVSHIISNKNFTLEEFDLTDSSDCNRIITKYHPDYFFNLAAQSHVGTSFKQPITTFQVDTIGVVNILESIRNYSSNTRFYQASTSEMFGKNYTENASGKYQNENTPFLPQSPYGVAKLAAHRMVQLYREAYGLFATSGILFNHESPRRGENFVTRKITNYIGQLINGIIPPSSKLGLGNLSANRDWGHAKDYVYAMLLMLEHNVPDDFVISTGQTYSVEHFCNQAFGLLDLNYKDYIFIDPEFYRPCEVDYLKGDSSKARNVLNWQPKISFDQLVKDMVYADIEKYKHVKKF